MYIMHDLIQLHKAKWKIKKEKMERKEKYSEENGSQQCLWFNRYSCIIFLYVLISCFHFFFHFTIVSDFELIEMTKRNFFFTIFGSSIFMHHCPLNKNELCNLLCECTSDFQIQLNIYKQTNKVKELIGFWNILVAVTVNQQLY